MIKDEVLGGGLIREGLSQLLDNPDARRMTCNVQVENAPAVMADDEETVQKAESDGGYGKEVHSGDGFAMVAKKWQPASRRLWISGRAFHPTGDGSLGNIEAEHKEFAVNARSAPSRILRHHAVDPVPNLLRDSFSSNLLSHLRDQAPIHAESGTVPAHHGLRSNYNERPLPCRPKPASEYPEESVEHAEFWFGMLALQRGELLPERQILQEQASA